MKRIIKNKIIFFICNFLGFLVLLIFLFKFFSFKEMGPFSWKEIWHYLPIDIIISLIFAVWRQVTRDE